jgi:hypothetical protein
MGNPGRGDSGVAGRQSARESLKTSWDSVTAAAPERGKVKIGPRYNPTTVVINVFRVILNL